MKIRVLTRKDFLTDAEKVSTWLLEMADASTGEFTENDIVTAIENNTHQPWAWTTDDGDLVGMFITSRVLYGEYHCMCIGAAAGDAMDNFEHATELFNQLAKTLNCQLMEMKGRKGLAKVFASTGWQAQYVTLRRAVMADNIIHPILKVGTE